MKWMSLLATIAALLGCGGGSPSQPNDMGGGGLTVAVRNNLFDPATLEVPVNSTVTWQWSSAGVEHNVTFQTEPSSENLTSGSFARTFSTAGTYTYICTIHGAQVMSGAVNVTGAPGGGGGGGGGGSGGGGGGYP
jgi:plastocyanin